MMYNTTITSVAVSYKDESPIFGENTITVSLNDEAAGPFRVLTDTNGATISIDHRQWTELDKVARMLVTQIE